jgi:hypothetical protein
METDTHATIQVLLEMFSTWSVQRGYKEDNCGHWVSSAWESVRKSSAGREPLFRQDLSAWSWRISSVRSHCQGTAGEDIVGWKRLSGFCGDLWIVEISDGAITACSSRLCVQVVNKSNTQPKALSRVTPYVWQYHLSMYRPLISVQNLSHQHSYNFLSLSWCHETEGYCLWTISSPTVCKVSLTVH